ncbi:MAG TPA: hypothetical protein VM934_09200 [Pyrinomonadaceae bacterium]|nr:hypothetical protein [Pyrinomonadaceae bacterium]
MNATTTSRRQSHRPARLRAAAGVAVRVLMLALVVCFAAQTTLAADNTIYATTLASPFTIYEVNTTTGALTPAGALAFGTAAAARRPSDGVVFYTEFLVTNGRVAIWNPTTNTNAVIGSLGGSIRQFPKLAFDAAGTLYGMDDQSRLYTVNTTNGRATLVGAGPITGLPADIRGDLAFSPNGTLYAVQETDSQLYTINIVARTATAVGTGLGTTNVSSLAFATNGTLYATTSDAPSDFQSVNPATGLASIISSQDTAIYDFASLTKYADLSVTKTATSSFLVGSNATYSIVVRNNGPQSASGPITVSDTLPAGLTYVSGTGTGWTCGASAGVVTCTNPGPVAVSTNMATITLTVGVGAAAAPSVTNTASVSGTTFDHVPANNSDSETSAVTTPTDLTIAKTHTGNFTQGQSGTYTINVTNSGGIATSGTVTVTDTLPAGLTPGPATGTGWTCTTSAQVVTCTRATVLNGGSSYPAISIPVNVATNSALSLTNTASVSGGGDTNTGNNTASDPTTINGVADLTIAKSHTGNFTQGQSGTYTLTVSNAGGAATSGTVTVSDTLPAGLTYVSGTGTGWTCGVAVQVVTCTNSTALAAATAYPAITLNVTVATNAPSSVTNTASVSGGGQTNTGNDSANDPTTINAAPNLTIAKTHTGNFTRGASGTYTITVTNSGSAATSGTVTVTDTLPAGLTPGPATGTGWTCTTSAQVVTCTRATALAAAGSYPSITLPVTVSQSAAASVTNTAGVSGGGQNFTGDDTASDPTTIVSSADLSLTKTVNNPAPIVGQNATFTVTLSNAGPTNATGVTVTDLLPAGLTFVSATPAAGTTYNSTTGAWAVPALTSGQSATLLITAQVNNSGAITNTAQVTASNQPDPDSTPDNNNAAEDDQASVSLGALTPPNVELVKSVTPGGTQLAGTDLTYSIVFKNIGGSPASALIISDKIPPETEFKLGSATYAPGTTGLAAPIVEYSAQPRDPLSADAPNPWVNYTPSGAPGTYDSLITYVRFRFTAGSLAPNTSGTITFTVRIR